MDQVLRQRTAALFKRATVLFVVVIALAAATTAAQSQSSDIVGVATVIDGDTIDIHGNRIRLNGIDAPERGGRCEAGQVNAYQRASLALSDIVGRSTVRCSVSGLDRYGRSIATCRIGGVDIADRLVQQGWARDWPRYSDGAYAQSEAQARRGQRGLWGMECPGLWGDRDYSR